MRDTREVVDLLAQIEEAYPWVKPDRERLATVLKSLDSLASIAEIRRL